VSDKRCACGEMLVALTYEGHRAITNLASGLTVAPVTITCLNGHTQELWMEPAGVEIWLRSVGVVSS
jgi:hypothetical protein